MTDDEPPGTGQTPSGGWEKLHPRTLAVTGITMVGIAALAGVPTTIGIAAATSLSVALAWVLPLAAVLIIAVAGYDLLRIRHTRYRVTDERVELESGLWFRSRRSLARERVRTVDLSADPLSRVFGLVRVKVGTGETGSGEGATTERSIDLDSVSRAAAEKLRQELLHRGGTLAAPGAESPDERIVTWRPAWLRYAPLSFLTPALALALAGAIFQVAEWFGRVDVPIEFVVGVVERHGIWTVLGVGLAAFLAVGALGSVLLHAESSWNHRLDREPGGTLRVRRGLLVSRSLSLEEQRIRGVEIVEPLGIRLASAARLERDCDRPQIRRRRQRPDHSGAGRATAGGIGRGGGCERLDRGCRPRSPPACRPFPAASASRPPDHRACRHDSHRAPPMGGTRFLERDDHRRRGSRRKLGGVRCVRRVFLARARRR